MERAAEEESGPSGSNGTPRVKTKTRKHHRLAETLDSSEVGEESSSTDWDTSDSEGGRGLLKDHRFKVIERVYKTFEQYLGIGQNISRTDVPWVDFLFAMDAIGFSGKKGAGSSWKFFPVGQIASAGVPISIHEPHPDPNQRQHQVSWVGKRLKRNYGLHMGLFEIQSNL